MKKQLILLTFAITSCSKIPLTSKVQNEFNSLGIKPNQIQYYLSGKVILQKKKVDRNSGLDQGNIEVKTLVTRERILFSASSFFPLPGVCKECFDNSYHVQFEEGASDLRALPFSWNVINDRFKLSFDNERIVKYDGDFYYVVFGTTAFLKVKKSAITRYKRLKRKAKGVRMSN